MAIDYQYYVFFVFNLSIKLSALQSSGYTIAKANRVCTQGTKNKKQKTEYILKCRANV